ncbi:hypothetical protein OHB24_19550 [Kribbella sp. NBC_00482]|uniref:hypothetical protein n=1 Tax=Kribbella sp. NBC_00482 TaxID=2975968 RepID=UPI002E191C22
MVLTPADAVASIVVHRHDDTFVEQLKAANASFADPTFEAELATYLRHHPQLVDAWEVWAEDQRWTPTAYFHGTETGWYDGAQRRHVRHHPDRAVAAADFIHRLAG